MFKSLLYLWIYLVEKTEQLILEHNSWKLGPKKLADPLLNPIFNGLSGGVEYMLSFQWTKFGLKCLVISLPTKSKILFILAKNSFGFHKTHIRTELSVRPDSCFISLFAIITLWVNLFIYTSFIKRILLIIWQEDICAVVPFALKLQNGGLQLD